MIDFRHPLEVQNLEQLQTNSALNAVLNIFNASYASLTSFSQLIDRSYPVEYETSPRIYRLYSIAKERIGIKEDIPLYLKYEYQLIAETVGTDGDCAIIMSSSCLDELTDDEILAVLGHELGHIYCEHVKYINIIKFFDDITSGMLSGIAEIALATLKNILVDWMRCAEYTADRAAAIVTMGIESPITYLSKALGGTCNKFVTDFNIENIVTQAEGGVMDWEVNKIEQIVLQNLMMRTNHPFAMFRIREIWEWGKSVSCKGDFPYVYYSNPYCFGLNDYTNGDSLFSQAQKIAPHNRDRGLALLHLAAKNGNTDAMDELGKLYLSDKIFSRNDCVGLTYLMNGAVLGGVACCYHLGMCYLQGISGYLPIDEEMGYHLIRYAAGNGYEKALERLKMRGPKQSEQKSVEIAKRIIDIFKSKISEDICKKINLTTSGHGVCNNNVSDLRKRLLIPQNDSILAYEIYDGIPERKLVVCQSGIYANMSKGLPKYISWGNFFEKNVEGREYLEGFDLLIDDEIVFSCESDHLPESIVRLLFFIKKNWEKIDC